MAIRCERCRGLIDDRSAFAVKLHKHGKHLLHDIVRATSLRDGEMGMHMNGDRNCGKPISGYKKHIVETLGFIVEVDTSFLDYL